MIKVTRVAAALPEKALTEAPVLENIFLWRPALTGVDMKLYKGPAARQRLAVTLKEKRERLKEDNAK